MFHKAVIHIQEPRENGIHRFTCIVFKMMGRDYNEVAYDNMKNVV